MKVRACLAGNLVRLRKERGIKSQAQLAEKARISTVVVARIETQATYPDEATIAALAAALGVSESRLFADPDAIPTPSPKEALAVLADALGIDAELKPRKEPMLTLIPLPPAEERLRFRIFSLVGEVTGFTRLENILKFVEVGIALDQESKGSGSSSAS